MHGQEGRKEGKIIIIIIIKRISRTPIYHTRWQHRALYNNTNHTHTHTHSVGRRDRQGCKKVTGYYRKRDRDGRRRQCGANCDWVLFV